jgi:tol-pal system protein YbgF
MKNKVITCTTVLLSLLLLESCSYVTVLRTREITAVQDTLRTQIAALDKKITDQQTEQNELLRQIRADQQVRFSELDQKIGELGSNLSENQYRLSKIYENTSDVQKQLEAKLVADSTSAKTQKSEIEKLFQIASDDFNAGRFDIARSGFQDLATRFPETSQGQESQFWIGECFYAGKSYDDAESALLLYVRNYPQGPKVCTALYKLGLCYEKLDKKKSRDLVWNKLLEKYPDSDEAKLVKSREHEKKSEKEE